CCRADDRIRDRNVTGVQAGALPIAAKRGRRDAPDPDRRMRLLQRLGLRTGAGDAVELALDAGLTLGPHGLEHAQGLVGGAAAPREVHAEDLELLAPPADADADDEPA